MKRLKISIVAVIAIIMGIAASAFTIPKTSPSDSWFTIQNLSLPNSASSYTYYGTSSPCSGNDVLCAIEGTRDPANMSQPLQSSVNAASAESGNFSHAATDVDFQSN